MAMTFISLLSTMIRLLPKLTSRLGGRASWLSVIPAGAAAVLLIYIVYSLIKNRDETQGLSDLILCSLGRPVGIAVCVLSAVWITIYSGFILRTSAERLISCVYPKSSLAAIFVVMILLAVMAACGRTKSLAGTGTVLTLIIMSVMLFACVFAVPGIKLEYVLPVASQDINGIFMAAMPVFNILSAMVYFLFLLSDTKKQTVTIKRAVVWTLGLAAVAMIIIVVTVGTFSAQLTESFQYPFFTLIRNIQVFRIVERFEALIIVVWICADFIYLSSMLLVVRKIMGSVTHKDNRISVWICAAAALFICFALGQSAFDLNIISDKYVPIVNVIFTSAVVPFVLLIGKIRKKI